MPKSKKILSQRKNIPSFCYLEKKFLPEGYKSDLRIQSHSDNLRSTWDATFITLREESTSLEAQN